MVGSPSQACQCSMGNWLVMSELRLPARAEVGGDPEEVANGRQVRLRVDRRGDERVVTQAFTGCFRDSDQMRNEFLRAVAQSDLR